MVEREAPGIREHDATALPASLARWISSQRWFANKGSLPQLEEIGSWQFDSASPDIRVVTHLFIDHTVGKPALYQVPLSYRKAEAPGLEYALVGHSEGDEPWFVYDGPHDPAYANALLEFIVGEREADGKRMHVVGHTTGWAAAPGFRSRVFKGEQSNTSVVFESDDAGATPVICKIFRALHDGENPEVQLQTALAAAGSSTVARPIGHITGDWDDTGRESGRARGHLAFAQVFLANAVDGRTLALRSARAGEDFSAVARALGTVTAEVHSTLAAALPVSPASRAEIEAVLASMRGRLADAVAEVPELADYSAEVDSVFARAATVPWPSQQRIHGDLHLAQALGTDGSWVLVDFEGEPLRPMSERTRLDFALRDVAGMLRSLDYIAGTLAQGEPPVDATDWAAAAREAYLDGYSARSGSDVRLNQSLLDAFELDKALYEVVYEARNRPSWLVIPVGAIERLVTRA